MFEQIQRRVTKIIPELRDLSYEECLKECGLMMNTSGLSISQRLPCPLAIWTFGLDGKSC